MTVITRFPPSPTGFLHVGRARTALFNYLFAKHNHGKMIFRIEDTDKERSRKEYEDDIIECLEWLGITYDAGPFRQSERTDIYKKYLSKLVDDGYAYISHEPSEKDTSKIIEVVRFKNPNKKITFTDLIRGEIEFDTTDLKDFVIAKSLDEPLYHLAVVVDDHEMGVTHIIRGEDGISNTPRQILIQEAIGANRTIYAHIPLILASDKSKLSGRHGAVSVADYRAKGYLPHALINFLALMGWNPGTNQEIFSLQELVEQFDLDKVQKSGAVFNIEKLNWFNRQYLGKLTDTEFVIQSKNFVPEWLASDSNLLRRLLPLLREKISVFGEIVEMFGATGELRFVQRLPNYEPKLLLWKNNQSREVAREHLVKCQELLGALPDDQFITEKIKSAIWPYAEAKGKGDVLWPLRVALTGQEKSPDPFMCAFILGREEAVERIVSAIKTLGSKE